MNTFKDFKLTALLLLFAINCCAQKQNNEQYTLTITADKSITDIQTRENLTTAFYRTYPSFAQADGYMTTKHAVLKFSNTLTPAIKAKAGEITVNPDWVKNKSVKTIEKTLRYELSRNWVSADTIKKNGYQLVFISKDPALDLQVKKHLIDTYFEVYPILVKTYNEKSTRQVLFVVDTAYKAVAEASNGRILFSAGYMKAHPTDIDVVTHETMHIVQGYGYNAGPVWLTEGIADYARYKYGVDNIGSKWSLPAYKENQHYTNSYRITARFFVWLEKNVKSGLIATLDQQLRLHTYTDQSWKALTGKDLDQLWADYSRNPSLELTYSSK